MWYQILGSIEIHGRHGEPLVVGRPKHRQLLATLLLAANTVVPADRLVESLWDGSPPYSSRGILKTYIWGLRRILSPADPSAAPIDTLGGGYRMLVQPEDLDLLVFKRLAAAGMEALRAGDAGAAELLLAQARALWRGRPFQCVRTSQNLATAAAQLEEEYFNVFEHWVEAELLLGRNSAVIGRLQARLGDDPLRERMCGQLMLALYRAGRQTDALQTFQDLRRHLISELGIEPSLPVQRLHQQMLAGDPDLFDKVRTDPFSSVV